jgi:hypothetical protein
VGDGDDYGFEMVGPSPELEAIWGPNAPSASRVDAGDDLLEPVAGSLIVPDPVVAPPARRRKPALAVGAAILVMVAMVVGAFVVAGTGDDGRDQSVTAAGAPRDDLVVDDESAANAQAFLDRWQAGPSTTLSLGAAGVPLSERPTTTTATTTTIARRRQVEPDTEPTFTTSPRRVVAPTTTTTERPPTLRADDPRLADAERIAREFVEAMMRRDCDAFWSAFSSNTVAFFEETAEEGESAKDEMCASLTAEEEIPVITVRSPARPHREGAVVDMEAEGEPETEPLYLVLEAEQWKVDLLGDMYSEE